MKIIPEDICVIFFEERKCQFHAVQNPAVLQIQEVQPRSTFHCTFFNHKVLTFIASYLADSKHFEALLQE